MQLNQRHYCELLDHKPIGIVSLLCFHKNKNRKGREEKRKLTGSEQACESCLQYRRTVSMNNWRCVSRGRESYISGDPMPSVMDRVVNSQTLHIPPPNTTTTNQIGLTKES